MGLAASQARLLLLTSRKNDIESQMMSISNDKLSLSRQSAILSQNYSDALNAQKLVWTTSTDTTDLSYGMLTSPAVLDGQYAVINSSSNAVIINDSLASKLGLSGDSGSGSDLQSKYTSAEAFVCAAMGITKSADVSTVSAATKAIVDAKSFNNVSSTAFETSYSDSDVFNTLSDSTFSFYTYTLTDDGNGHKVDVASQQSSYFMSDGSAQPVSIGQYSNLNDLSGVASAVKSFVAGICDTSSEAVLSVLASNYEYSDDVTQLLEAAAAKASKDTENYYFNRVQKDDGNGLIRISGSANSNADETAAIAEAKKGNTEVFAATGNNASEIYLDVSQVVKTFLAYFDAEVAMINGNDEGTNGIVDDADDKAKYTGEIGTRSTATTSGSTPMGTITTTTIEGGHYKTQEVWAPWSTTTTTYAKVSRPSSGIGGTGATCGETVSSDAKVDEDKKNDLNNDGIGDGYEEKYYINLYNLMSSYGWELNASVSSSNYFQNQVMSGNMTVLQLGADGTWNALSVNGTNSPLETEADDSKTTEAEAEYEAKKDQLDYKESKLDLQMNDLDTERSAITTELDSVQKIINKNIESSFKLFQNA